MPATTTMPTNVVRFPGARASASPQRDQKSLMDAVYTAGSLPVSADDRATKTMATRLQIFGFVLIDEVQPDGSVRRLRPSEAVQASTAHPWRLSKPRSWDGGVGQPDAAGDLPARAPSRRPTATVASIR